MTAARARVPRWRCGGRVAWRDQAPRGLHRILCAGFLPKEGTARGVQIDIAPAMLSPRYPMEVTLMGDSAQTLRAFLPLLDRKTERSWRGHVEDNIPGHGK